MLPRRNRLPKKEVVELLKRGSWKRRAHFSLIMKNGHNGISRFAFIVGRNVSKKTVVRNRLRRRLAVLIRPYTNTPHPLDIAIRPNPEAALLPFSSLKQFFQDEVIPFLS